MVSASEVVVRLVEGIAGAIVVVVLSIDGSVGPMIVVPFIAIVVGFEIAVAEKNLELRVFLRLFQPFLCYDNRLSKVF